MKARSPYAISMLTLFVGACAYDRQGVIRDLPPPVALTPMQYTHGTTPQRVTSAPPARELPLARSATPRAWQPPGGIGNRWDAIVVHHSASDSGNASLFDKYHRRRKGWDELGYHFVIGNGHGSGDGLVEVGPRWIKQKHGAHCKTSDNFYNEHGIGICLVGDFRTTRPTDAQIQSLTRLTRYLMKTCHIPVSGVTTHRAVTGKTVCPGSKFPFNSFRRTIAGYAHATFAPTSSRNYGP